jgi:hypothetical protein
MYNIPRALAATPDLVDGEKRALHYFRSRVALEITAPFTSELWTECVYRFADHSDFLQSALVAMSSMHESYSPRAGPRKVLRDDATRFYNKAMRQISRSAESEISTEALLVAVILFHSFECLRGNFQRALQHVHAGLKIIDERFNKPGAPINAAICDAFIALQNQAREFSTFRMTSPFSPLNGYHPLYRDLFNSWNDAHSQLEIIYNEVYSIIDYCQTLQQSQADLQAIWENNISPVYDGLAHRFSCWQAGIAKLGVSGDDDRPARLLVQMYQSLFAAIFESFPSSDCFDNYNTNIETALRLANEYIEYERHELATRRSFSLSSGVVPILFMLAWRSGNVMVRDTSLDLLKRARRREGLWDAVVACQMGSTMVDRKQSVGAYAESSQTLVQMSGICFDTETSCRLTWLIVGGGKMAGPGEFLPQEGHFGEQRYIEDFKLPSE